MNSRRSIPFERLSLRHYLVVMIVCIILIITGILISGAYLESKADRISQDEFLRQYTDLNVRESVRLVNQGLDLFDSSLNDQMKAAYPAFLDEYARAGGEPAAMDLLGLKEELQDNFEENSTST